MNHFCLVHIAKRSLVDGLQKTSEPNRLSNAVFVQEIPFYPVSKYLGKAKQ